MIYHTFTSRVFSKKSIVVCEVLCFHYIRLDSHRYKHFCLDDSYQVNLQLYG